MSYLGGHGELLRVRRRSSHGWLWRAWHRHRTLAVIVSGALAGGLFLAGSAVAERLHQSDAVTPDARRPSGDGQPGQLVRDSSMSRSVRREDVVLIRRTRDGRILVSVPTHSAVRVEDAASD